MRNRQTYITKKCEHSISSRQILTFKLNRQFYIEKAHSNRASSNFNSYRYLYLLQAVGGTRYKNLYSYD